MNIVFVGRYFFDFFWFFRECLSRMFMNEYSKYFRRDDDELFLKEGVIRLIVLSLFVDEFCGIFVG